MNNNEIIEAYKSIEAGEPDISTERLLAMTADRCDVDMERVIDALMDSVADDLMEHVTGKDLDLTKTSVEDLIAFLTENQLSELKISTDKDGEFVVAADMLIRPDDGYVAAIVLTAHGTAATLKDALIEVAKKVINHMEGAEEDD